MTNSELDTLILKAIKAIEEHNDSTFKPRIKTITSFLKGTEKVLFTLISLNIKIFVERQLYHQIW